MAAREMQDFAFTFSLPCSRRQVAASKVLTTALLELAMVAVVLLAVSIKGLWSAQANPLGLGGNYAFAGVLFLTFGMFNALFYPLYLRNPNRVGIPFLAASLLALMVTAVIQVVSLLPAGQVLAAAPFSQLGAQLFILAAGALIFCALTALAITLASRTFSRYNATL
jgi:hypothetical protein